MTGDQESLSVAEMRRRRKEREALTDRVKDLADAQIVATRKRAAELAQEKQEADTAAAHALAVAVRLYGSPDEVSELTGIPLAEVERAVRATRSAEVDEERQKLQEQAQRKLAEAADRRRRRSAGGTGQPAQQETAAPTVPAPAAAPAEASR